MQVCGMDRRGLGGCGRTVTGLTSRMILCLPSSHTMSTTGRIICKWAT
jgi:hypothetical protein